MEVEKVEKRYTVTQDNFPREVVLLVSDKCKHRKCVFCDYWMDGSNDMEYKNKVNLYELSKITGETGVLEIINSGSIFELPESHIEKIIEIIYEKNIHTFMFESHWMYHKQVQELRWRLESTGVKVIAKIGIETFDSNYREKYLNKGMNVPSNKIWEYYQGVNLLIGLPGQTMEMVERDIKLALMNFEVVIINIFTPNSRIQAVNRELIEDFYMEYECLRHHKKVLWYDHKNSVGLG